MDRTGPAGGAGFIQHQQVDAARRVGHVGATRLDRVAGHTNPVRHVGIEHEKVRRARVVGVERQAEHSLLEVVG